MSTSLSEPDAPICPSGKRPFRTEEKARKGVQAAQWTRKNLKGGYRPGSVEETAYQCKVCQWWHLTSAATPRRRRGDFANRARRQPKRR